MTSVASTTSGASFTVTSEQIVKATTKKHLQALLKSVDLDSTDHTMQKEALSALIQSAIKQATHAVSSVLSSKQYTLCPVCQVQALTISTSQSCLFPFTHGLLNTTSPCSIVAEPSVTDQQHRLQLTDRTCRLEEHGLKHWKNRTCYPKGINLVVPLGYDDHKSSSKDLRSCCCYHVKYFEASLTKDLCALKLGACPVLCQIGSAKALDCCCLVWPSSQLLGRSISTQIVSELLPYYLPYFCQGVIHSLSDCL